MMPPRMLPPNCTGSCTAGQSPSFPTPSINGFPNAPFSLARKFRTAPVGCDARTVRGVSSVCQSRPNKKPIGTCIFIGRNVLAVALDTKRCQEAPAEKWRNGPMLRRTTRLTRGDGLCWTRRRSTIARISAIRMPRQPEPRPVPCQAVRMPQNQRCGAIGGVVRVIPGCWHGGLAPR